MWAVYIGSGSSEASFGITKATSGEDSVSLLGQGESGVGEPEQDTAAAGGEHKTTGIMKKTTSAPDKVEKDGSGHDTKDPNEANISVIYYKHSIDHEASLGASGAAPVNNHPISMLGEGESGVGESEQHTAAATGKHNTAESRIDAAAPDDQEINGSGYATVNITYYKQSNDHEVIKSEIHKVSCKSERRKAIRYCIGNHDQPTCKKSSQCQTKARCLVKFIRSPKHLTQKVSPLEFDNLIKEFCEIINPNREKTVFQHKPRF